CRSSQTQPLSRRYVSLRNVSSVANVGLVWVGGDDKGNGGQGIWGSGDDNGVSGDGGGVDCSFKDAVYRHEGQPQDADDRATGHIMRIQKMPPKKRIASTTTTTTPMTDAQLKALIAQDVADALVERDTDRSRTGDDNHDSRTGKRRQAPPTRECTYSDFLKCQSLNFKDTLRNNQNQQQPFKRYNVARAYAVVPGEKKPYGRSKPLCLVMDINKGTKSKQNQTNPSTKRKA
nr:hypothetical protein [Tanacetum cinerariifolium]